MSIEEEPCLAFFSAARWNGHAHHRATGAVQATSSHCQPGNRSDGTSDIISDKSVSKHSTSIFAKLDLAPSDDDNRRVLAVLAYLGG